MPLASPDAPPARWRAGGVATARARPDGVVGGGEGGRDKQDTVARVRRVLMTALARACVALGVLSCARAPNLRPQFLLVFIAARRLEALELARCVGVRSGFVQTLAWYFVCFIPTRILPGLMGWDFRDLDLGQLNTELNTTTN